MHGQFWNYAIVFGILIVYFAIKSNAREPEEWERLLHAPHHRCGSAGQHHRSDLFALVMFCAILGVVIWHYVSAHKQSDNSVLILQRATQQPALAKSAKHGTKHAVTGRDKHPQKQH